MIGEMRHLPECIPEPTIGETGIVEPECAPGCPVLAAHAAAKEFAAKPKPEFILKLGDSREILASMKPDRVDSLVCDPPAGIEFMGKEWDAPGGVDSRQPGEVETESGPHRRAKVRHGTTAGYGETLARDRFIVSIEPIFRECLRVMKPGAHGLVWALPRTSHWTATALEDAGFEIRDVVMHLFGTGFPKSLDVSKAIDKAAGAVRLPSGTVTTRHGGGARSDKIRQLNPDAKETPNTIPATAEAIRFAGWGTALKPACEHWILVRKPLAGTVAANVLAHGTGGLNIDACRIGFETVPGASLAVNTHLRPDVRGAEGDSIFGMGQRETRYEIPAGRWPAHLVLDEEAAAMLDEQSGPLAARGNRGPSVATTTDSVALGKMTPRGSGAEYNYDAGGGASRFFYCAKPGRKERDAGCEDLPPRSGGEATDREDGTDGLKSPRAGAGRGGGARNHHPTVKAVELMRWLVRLITPPGGVVLDPFLGSGSTGIAAVAEGMRFIGIEREADYIEIARRRIAHAASVPVPEIPGLEAKPAVAEVPEVNLFEGATGEEPAAIAMEDE